MRVHELAKELNLKSQEIIDVLSGTEHAVSSHSSSIDEVAQQIVRNKFKSKGKTTQDMNIKSEEKMCRYGVCILLIQAGKYGLYREEFEYYY